MDSNNFGTYYLDNECSNRNNENVETESFKLLFIVISSFFVYNFSTKLFENNKNFIKPLECSYKYLFNYVNNEEVDDVEEVEEEIDDVEEVEVEEEVDDVEEVDDEEEEIDDEEEEVDDEEEEIDDEEEEIDDEEEDVDDEEEDVDEEENKYNDYYELFKEQEFKMLLLNFLKNKEKDLSDVEKLKKYKSLIENLEKDILEYVYV